MSGKRRDWLLGTLFMLALLLLAARCSLPDPGTYPNLP
jgi:hypothetical protein